jgi:hypothetical protein
MVSDSLSSIFSKQSLAYWLILIPVSVVSAALVTLADSLAIAFLAGAIFVEIVNAVLEWAREWYDAEQRVEEVSPDA